MIEMELIDVVTAQRVDMALLQLFARTDWCATEMINPEEECNV